MKAKCKKPKIMSTVGSIRKQMMRANSRSLFKHAGGPMFTEA